MDSCRSAGDAHAAAAGGADPDLDRRIIGARACSALCDWTAGTVAASPPDAAPALVQRLRAARPDPAFTISFRVRLEAANPDRMRTDLAAYRAAGVQHVLLEPMERDLDAWLRAVEDAAKLINAVA